MFRGISGFSLDGKGRMAIPSRYREELRVQAEDALVLTLNPFDRCLWAYPRSQWEEIERKLAALSDADWDSRQTKRMMRGYATDCRLDGQGRVLIPKPLREHAGLGQAGMFLGQGNKFEIWDAAAWNEQRSRFLESLDTGNAALSGSLGSLSL